MAIKINLMPESQKKGWQMPQSDLRLHSTSVLIFLFSLFCFLGVYLYKFYFIPNKLDALENNKSALIAKIKTSLDPNMVSMGKKAINAEKLLNGRLYWSKFFETLEQYTLKNISYDQFVVKQDSLKSTIVKAEINGHTDNFAALSRQVAVFMTRKELSNIKFNGGEMDKDGVINFKFTIEIDPDSLKDKSNK